MDTFTSKNRHLPRLLILYGSQTGTAQDVAENIAMQSRGSPFNATATSLDSYPVKNLLEETVVLFICSTTGQGEPPDNMKKFWRFIMRKNLPLDSLSNLRFGVLGLGDSSYIKYNFVAKKLERRIQQLGGHKLLDIGLADDQHDWGADATIDPWVTKMWEKLMQLYPISEQDLNPLSGDLPPARFVISHREKAETEKSDLTNDGYSRETPFLAPLLKNTRVTSENHFQTTVHLVFNVSEAWNFLSYEPGDVLMVQPSNIEENINAFLSAFNQFPPDDQLNILVTNPCDTIPNVMKNTTTLRQLTTSYFDFMSIPRRSFFQLLQHFATDELEKEKLMEFSMPEGTEERYSYVNRPRRTILEVLQDFHQTAKNIPLLRLLELIPAIQPRAFSIASSPTKHKNEIHILVAVVKYKTKLHKPRQGLCSTWLSTLAPGVKVPIWVKRGGIHFSSDPEMKDLGDGQQITPFIMIGPGTGVAPFRSAIHERMCKGLKENTLFFGCRNSQSDFYFEDEWKRMINEGYLSLHTAFSRDQDDKIYVQHRIKEAGKILWNLVKKAGASIFVAGNSKNMPDAVRDSFLQIFKEYGEMDDSEAFRFYETLQKERRYQQETWS